VEEGLAPGELLYLNVPEDGDSFKLEGEDLIEKIREKKRIEREDWIGQAKALIGAE